MWQLTSATLFIFFVQICYSQTSESYANLPEGTIKREIALFAKSGGKTKQVDSVDTKLTEIKLRRCADDFAFFESGNIVALDKLVSIRSKKITFTNSKVSANKRWGMGDHLPVTEVAEVRYIHYKYQLILPDSAIAGLFNPKFCINTKKNNKAGKTTISNCRVYQSKDKKRVYIYMLNGENPKQYEVTWVIENSQYCQRIIDEIR
ncbi:hypothetical protein [Foetidibacter luteolus]|uniref:hypothetical protein n=1 Tax=Foetidibacter luteolus TaxID=2608880 RepID=UPI00129B938B|nr:hypothetical protein [Foetidibacter luteolus]